MSGLFGFIAGTKMATRRVDMTHLLRQAITEIEKLPATEQDSVAARILAELADDQVWAAKFAATTDEQWDRLAESVRREIAAN
jgi:hypothetical protein